MGFAFRDIATVLGERCESVINNPVFAPVVQKTGIPVVFETDGSSLDLARSAIRQLLDRNTDLRGKVDVLICVTQSPVDLLPSMSCRLQHDCDLPNNILAFDIGQGCSGFVQAFVLTAKLLLKFDNILIVCTDSYRSKLDHSDRSTASVFSDAATVTWVSSGGDLSVLAESHFADGSGRKFLFQEVLANGVPGTLHMSGADVLLFAQRVVPEEISRLLTMADVSSDEIDNWYFHQASKLVLDKLESRIHPKSPIRRNIEHFGNTVSSSIPLLLAEDLDLLGGKLSVLCGFGVGLSASCVLVGPSNSA